MKQRLQSKEEQRSAIMVLRMIGSSKIEVLMNQKDNLFEYSEKFAKFEKPDFIILKEALLAYEKIMNHQLTASATEKKKSRKKKEKGKASLNAISEEDKKYLF